MIPFEKMTDRCRKVIKLAEVEARSFNHPELDTGHILLGLIAEGMSLAAHILQEFHLTRAEAKQLLIKINAPSMIQLTEGHKFLLNQSCQNLIDASGVKAEELNQSYIGAEHLLLGLLSDPNSVACQILGMADLNPASIARALLSILGHAEEDLKPQDETGRSPYHLDDDVNTALEQLLAALDVLKKRSGRTATLILIPHASDEKIFMAEEDGPISSRCPPQRVVGVAMAKRQ